MKITKILFTSIGILFLSGIALFGQTQKEVVDAYNKGVKLISSDIPGAIASFEECVSLADQVGDEAKETRDLAAAQIPGLYYKLALGEYKKKNIDGAIEGFKKTQKEAEKYGDTKIASRCKSIIPKLYYAKGTSKYKTKDFAGALVEFDQAIALNPKYASPYLGKALVYDKQNDYGKMKEAADKAIEVGLASRDNKTVHQVERFMQTGSFNRAVKSIQAGNMDEAEEYLRNSIEYGNDSPDVYYQLGKIYNEKKDYAKAIENLQKALTLDKGQENAKARYYYLLGEVYKAENKKVEACDAFRKALYPPYDERAKYEIGQLKCQ